MASLQRIALFIMFDEMERDLIRIIASLADSSVLNDSERVKATARIKNLEIADTDTPIEHLLPYLDLGEKLDIIMRVRPSLSDAHSKYIASKQKAIEASIPIRNAVMHGRPLTIGEYANGFALANDLARSPHYWPLLSAAIKQYGANPDAVRARSIEILDTEDLNETLNNLPIPDYDDTGFLPRAKLEEELKKKILNRHPVVTVLGDGGNGKTALTLQTLYGLLNSADHGFDAIVWVSAKSSMLTTTEIKRIESAITTSTGIFSKVADIFENDSDDPFSSVRALLSSNKILLAIDNLETVLDQAIRDFISDVPGESKIIFTSRIPIGSDITVSVGEFSETESVTYLRRVIDAYNVASLKKRNNEELKLFAKRLGGKPLLLKWFALSVLAGSDPHAVVRDPVTALRFCLENVFDSLSIQARTVVSIFSLLPRPVSLEVLRFVSGKDVLDLEKGVSELLMYTIIQARETNSETVYELKTFARAYISRIIKMDTLDSDGIVGKFRSLEAVMQDETGADSHNKYDMKRYTVRNISEALCVKHLRIAVRNAMNGNIEVATDVVRSAKISNPGYFEVYRAEAHISFLSRDYMSAKDCYQRAIDIAPDKPQLRLFYAGFLIRAYGDFEAAVEELKLALAMDEASPILNLELARVKMFRLDFTNALEDLRRIPQSTDRLDKFQVKVKDVELNIYKRHLEYLLAHKGTSAQIEKVLGDWSEFHEALDPRLIDDKMLDTIVHLLEKIQDLQSRNTERGYAKLLNSLRENVTYVNGGSNSMSVSLGSGFPLSGTIKPNGLKPDFGFLVFDRDKEIFIHQSSCSPECWQKIKAGSTCLFTTTVDPTGRVRVASASVAD